MTRARDLADSADKDIAGTLTLDDLTVGGTAYVTGDLTVDTDTLYVDTTNNRVGIGTTSPDALLDVSRSGNGQIAVLQTSASRGFSFESQSDTALQIASIQGSTNLDLWANTLTFSAGAAERMRIDSSGRVGIANTNPYGALTIGNNSADDTVDYSKGIVFVDTLNSTSSPWVHAGIVTTGSSGYSGNLIFATDGDGNQTSGVSALTERMRIDSAGRVTMPYQPAFMVTQAGSTHNQTGVVVDFNSVIENRGGHFSTSTNRFTAPVTGMYHFHVHTFLDQGNTSSGEIYLRRNGSNYGFGYEIRNYTQDIHSGYGPPLTIQATVGLNANDYVDVYTNIGLHANYGTYFGGYLLG